MSVRRKIENRLTLYRTCHTCGKSFSTTASTPFVRQIKNIEGKKQKTCYFCSESCKTASYKHLYDGKAEERRQKMLDSDEYREKQATLKRRYYTEHRDEILAAQKARYWADVEVSRADSRYRKKKRKLLGAIT